MAKRMLVDATHPEETRVVVVDGTRLEEFDFETSSKKQLKGNIYLAKVVRIEPSLQAAFVEYGGNRHGFLAFSEIHPDYYQIPIADREKLLAEQAQRAQREDEGGNGDHSGRVDRSDIEDAREERAQFTAELMETSPGQVDGHAAHEHEPAHEAPAHEASAEPRADAAAEPPPSAAEPPAIQEPPAATPEEPATRSETIAAAAATESLTGPAVEDAPAAHDTTDRADGAPAPAAPTGHEAAAADLPPAVEGAEGSEQPIPAGPTDAAVVDPSEAPQPEVPVETLGGDDYEQRPRRSPPPRQYKIQEVIKRRQILLVQVVKEERGNKGAALTTYLSLAGRYAVLMPNAGRGGGISRKITNAGDRKRMKEMLAELDVPSGMGVILRTAGLERSKAEIRRDYDYLMRLWDSIRDLTFQSKAPALIYEEGDIVKRSIRDLYNSDIEEVQIEGEHGFGRAQDFMRQLIPSHVPKVKLYRDGIPLFHRYQIETQLDAMHSPIVQLRSGAYIVINPTEALVAIDVNSGRATKERNIEETALRTNLEAAEEIARQVRLRDLAGLVVIDFIDMEESKHQGQVERRLKEAMKSDRARIQIGRISPFGLLELSRQRLRPSLLENVTEVCPHCEGTGRVRSVESTALHVLRGIEEEGVRRRAGEIVVKVPVAVALYLLNHKRTNIADAEQRYGFHVLIAGDDDLIPPHYDIERTKARSAVEPPPALRQTASAQYDEFEDGAEADDGAGEPIAEALAGEDSEDGRRRRRRRRRRRGEGKGEGEGSVGETTALDDTVQPGAEPNGDARLAEEETPEGTPAAADDGAADAERDDIEAGTPAAEADEGDGQRRRRRGRRGGRGRRRDHDESTEAADGTEPGTGTDAGDTAEAPVPPPAPDAMIEPPLAAVTEEPPPAAAVGEPPLAAAMEEPPPAPVVAAAEEPPAALPEPPPVPTPALEIVAAAPEAEPPPASVVPSIAVEAPPEKPRRGWWSRLTS
ncbi:Rne/Rng family ribonuclease [Vineibacter terrae]|uniref:Rne/Rng family ribonuclease n=1 Tax=Vineibacter terrae TaxID=2586908 RepID=UPI002E37D7A7|nr:Rne/Rng family ribonuclease [Vineibacter terrae]HEX2889184.1 Rne/Rng family ribonuclease [Vineibacter terrae]